MGQINRSPRNVRFGVFEADIEAGELRKHGLRLKLSEQPFQILTMLLATPGEIVSRDYLRERLWPGDTFVDFDHGLNNAVMRLREVLGDSSDHPRFIETIPRRGYRFIAPVEVKKPATDDSVALPAPVGEPFPQTIVGKESKAPGKSLIRRMFERQSKRSFALSRIAALAVAVLAGSALISGITMHYVRGVNASKGRANRSSSLVVLPLENLSGEKGAKNILRME